MDGRGWNGNYWHLTAVPGVDPTLPRLRVNLPCQQGALSSDSDPGTDIRACPLYNCRRTDPKDPHLVRQPLEPVDAVFN
jgi:hypothetical protein